MTKALTAALWLCAISSWWTGPAHADAREQSAHQTHAAWQQISNLGLTEGFTDDQPIGFVERRKTRLHKKPQRQSGELWLANNGDFVMQVKTPRAEQRRLTTHDAGTTLTLIRGKRTRSMALDNNRSTHQLLLAVTQLLQGDTTWLAANFTVQGIEPHDPNRWAWLLQPIDGRSASGISRLVLQGHGHRLAQLRAERGNSWQEILLQPHATK